MPQRTYSYRMASESGNDNKSVITDPGYWWVASTLCHIYFYFPLYTAAFCVSVNNTNSGDGKETLSVKFDHDLEISFNSRYLIDVASQLDGEKIELFLNDTGSPALIKDPGDFDSIFVVMPMKG